VPVAGAVLVGYSVALSITVNRLGLRNCWRYLAGSVGVLATGWIVGAQFFAVDLLLLPLLLSGSLSLLFTQVNRLWSLDRQFARTLLNSPVTNADSIVGANERLASGLKLLNTVLPLNEAVVFTCAESNTLEPVVRYKSPAPNPQDPRRNAVWREGVRLCQHAASTGKLMSHKTQESATVAVPLLHEGETAGVPQSSPMMTYLYSKLSVHNSLAT
jgi:hypothetical protein